MNMISTGAFLTEMNAPTEENRLVKSLVSAWEKKNSKVGRAGGVSLLALTLAACGDEDETPFSQADVDAAVAAVDITSDNDAAILAAIQAVDATATTVAQVAANATAAVDITSDNAAVVAAAEAAKDATIADLTAQLATLQASYDAVAAPTSAALTDDDAAGIGPDYVAMSPSNDTITATTVTYDAADVIADNSTTDSDTLTMTATGDVTTTPQVVNVENVNFVLESFTATGQTADAIFEVAADNIQNSTAISVDLNKTGSAIASATVTGLEDGSTVNFSDDFTTAVIVTGDDNAGLTATSKAAAMTANSGGTLTAATMTSTSTAAVTMTTDSDAAATFTTTAADMVISAASATTVVATSAKAIDANTTDIGAATSVTLTAVDEVNVGLDAATTATISAGGTTASTIDDALGNTLTSLSLSGNGTAHEFSIVNSEGVSSVTITGDQNVTVTASAADIDGLTSNKLTVVDSSSATSTLKVGTAAGDMDLSAAAVDAIDLAIDNNTKAMTVADGASVTISVDQTATTIDGLDAGAASNAVTVTLDDGATAANATVDVGTSLTFTDIKTATVNVASDSWASGTMTASSITGLTGSADNTNVTIEAGANGVTLASTANVGTGTLTINSTGAVALGGTDVTATSLTVSGTGAVTATALDSSNVAVVTTGDGGDALTFDELSAGFSVATGGGNDTITITTQSTAASKTYSINGGDGSDTLSIGTASFDANNGTAFTLTGIETISTANGITASTVGAALLDGKNFIMTQATAADTMTYTIEMGTATSLDLSGLVINTATLTAADDFSVSSAAATAALTLTGANGMKNTFVTGSGADTITGGDVADAITAGDGADTITGGAGNDVIDGEGGADVISGGAGDDTITGAAGADTMTGGAGNDTYTFANAAHVVAGESIVEAASGGTDIINVDATVDFTNLSASSLDEMEQIDLAAGVTATFTGDQLTGETIELVSPNAGDAQAAVVNVAFGGTADLSTITVDASWTVAEDTVTINGLGGNETIRGTATNDAINLGAGADTLQITFGGAGVDTITGFTGGAGGDVLDLVGTIDINDAAGNDLDTDGFLLVDGTASVVIADGLTVVDGNSKRAVDAGAQLTAAEIATFLADMTAGGTAQAMTVSTAADVAYVLVEGEAGTSTLAKVTGGANTAIDTADITLIAHFTSFESEDFIAANAADFA